MIVVFLRNRFLQFTARVMLICMIYQITFPVTSFALTSGPSQPEMQSFEPVGTTDMVDLFSGDFNYNIPLLDVEGYPVNIAYHGGTTIEQEASWVGLGWNINPGNINHVIRGVSDDFKGDEIKKTLIMTPEKNNKVGLFLGAELAGLNMKGLSEAAKKALKKLKGSGSSIDFAMNFNNYNGVSASLGNKKNLSMNIMPGVNLGLNTSSTINTATGADFDYGASVSFSIKSGNYNLGFNVNGGMNSRDGLKYTSFGVNPSIPGNGKLSTVNVEYASLNASFVPIGVQNYVPVITNASSMTSNFYQLKVGGELWALYPYGGGNYSSNKIEYEENANKNAYGYFYLDHAGSENLVDFTRDKDGKFNKKSLHIPMANMTYDIYSASGQGTGGSFRPFRSDIGTVSDPLTLSKKNDNSYIGEIGFGNVNEVGFDTKIVRTKNTSGVWEKHSKKFESKKINKIFEPFYFKQAGELTESDDYFSNGDPLSYSELQTKMNTNPAINKRNKRANLLYFLTGEEASARHISTLPDLENYDFDGFKVNLPEDATKIDRETPDYIYRKGHHASEFTQILPDGRRYVYGLPVYNIIQKDFEISAPENPSLINNTYNISTSGTKPIAEINDGIKYYSETETPGAAHSYMLTSIISSDYTDLTGDGISDDDLGNYTKFNYRQKNNYQWRTPYNANTAQFNKGLSSDCRDNKGNFSIGIREQWMLHSIESKNFVAEFFISERIDAKASNDATLVQNPSLEKGNGIGEKAFKLDSIVLYNKQDRFSHHLNATPIKTVIFNYDYTLCPGLPNSLKGKLTLKSLFIKHGTSSAGLMSPYQFAYGKTINPTYNFMGKDCWGNYKPSNSNSDVSKNLGLNLNNNEFPYVNQNDPQNDEYANAWNLTKVQLPSGGIIKVEYESDDYAYVQDKKAMEMFKVDGAGPSKEYNTNNSLYSDINSPYLYLYFKRKTIENSSSIEQSYLDSKNIIQYTFDVEISPGAKASCPNTKLSESIKGYAKVIESGACSDGVHGYIKIEEKDPNNFMGLEALGKEVKINPITLAAINFARYNNMKALKPESDINDVGDQKAVIKQLISSFGEQINTFQNPLKTFLKKQKAKYFDNEKSYIRLVSQGLKKKGGGNRVKRIEFTDNWSGESTTNSYGSEYNYTIIDESNNKEISSGVATYEPMFGGDENPNRKLNYYQEASNNSKFPPLDPIELLNEDPIGETLYPSPSVGYSKVTVTSIHKAEGASSQTIQEKEFYTSKDFPVIVKFNNDKVRKPIESEKPKIYQLFHKKEILRVAEGYSLYLNDMHGKSKKESIWVSKDASLFNTKRELVSYTKYNYFTNADNNQLSNSIPCLEFNSNSSAPQKVNKSLGIESDLTIDSRSNEQKSKFTDIHFSTNTFLAPPVPICIPVPFPTFKQESNVFTSLSSTKVIQQYGIIKSVETYDKGSKVLLENEAFDSQTGQALITKVNSEFNDNIYDIKYPAYWAYRCMGAAYENILFEENVKTVPVEDGIAYVEVEDLDKYNIGDEIKFDYTSKCQDFTGGKSYKLWVVDKQTLPEKETVCDVECNISNSNPLLYKHSTNGINVPAENYPNSNLCPTLDELKTILVNILGDNSIISDLNSIKKVEIIQNGYTINSPICHVFANTNLCALAHPPPFISFFYQFNKAPYSVIYEAKTWSPFPTSFPTPNPNTSNLNETKLSYVIYEDGIVDYKNQNNNPTLQVAYNQKIAKLVNIYVTGNNTIPLSNICSPLNNIKTSTNDLPSKSIPFDNAPCKHTINAKLVQRVNRSGCVIYPATNNTTYKKYLLLKAMNRNSESIYNLSNWPSNAILYNTKLKVIRSGKRNQLTENVQELTALENPFNGSSLKTTFTKALSASSRTYTDIAAVPEEIADESLLTNIYYNPFVNGRRGNYRVNKEMGTNKLRDYTSSLDKNKGAYSIDMYWNFSAVADKEFYSKMMLGAASWTPKNYVNIYSPWGKDLQVEDGVHNKHSNIFGYNNSIPTAVVSNSEYNNSMFENFEDYNNINISNSFIQYIQNNIRYDIKNQFIPQTLSGTNFSIITNAHTGKMALQINNNYSVSIPVIVPNSIPTPIEKLEPFKFRTNQKYLVSFWQKVGTATPPINPSINISIVGSATMQAKRKTPVIDGWAQYEGILNVNSTATNATINFISLANNNLIDDIRILPIESNMKSYVFDNKNKKLVAVLDENNMATYFEYNQEGKLARLKKETEKGIITLKESRESLRKIIGNPPPDGAFSDLNIVPASN